MSEWKTIDSAPKDRPLIGLVDGKMCHIYYGKTSHVPMYGWNMVPLDVENCELCEPTHWFELPESPVYP